MADIAYTTPATVLLAMLAEIDRLQPGEQVEEARAGALKAEPYGYWWDLRIVRYVGNTRRTPVEMENAITDGRTKATEICLGLATSTASER